MKNAYFAGGCFWCITPLFKETEGVSEVVCGYCGGREQDPTYEQVKHQQTGHRETIRVCYDENRTGYAALLEMFLSAVDLFDEGGQFIDRGRSYTLAVYYETEEERELVCGRLREIEEMTGRRTFVSVEPFERFWDAEEYHQDWYLKHPEEFERELVESGRKKA